MTVVHNNKTPAMHMEISYNTRPITILDAFDAVEPVMKLEDFEVRINGEKCPPTIRDIILMGLNEMSRVRNKTFRQIAQEYLEGKGI